MSTRRYAVSAVLSVLLISGAWADDEDTATQTQEPPQENTVTTTTIQPSADGTSSTKTVETHHTITTTIPAANSDMAIPEGFVSCATMDASWVDDVWVPAHKVCKYENASEGVAWIEGYWKCTKATMDGACTIWEWQNGHWQK